MVPGTGIEPVRCRHRGILSPLRLPISPPGHYSNELDSTETGQGCREKMEAEVGIEPASTALQAAA